VSDFGHIELWRNDAPKVTLSIDATRETRWTATPFDPAAPARMYNPAVRWRDPDQSCVART
jgi:hypothetical protein